MREKRIEEKRQSPFALEDRKKKQEWLKWEYLKRSEPYKEYCEWNRQKATNPALPLLDKFQPATGPIQNLNPIVRTYSQNGDVHAQSFEKWYEERIKPYENFHQGAIDDLSEGYFLKAAFNIIIDKFKQAHGREPSIQEMIDLLIKQMQAEQSFGMRSYFSIKQERYTFEEADRLSKKVATILKDGVSKNRIRYAELNTYLVTYDMKKHGKSDKEIIKVIYDVKDVSDATGKRSKDGKSDKELSDEINKYFKYAERIIRNTEKDDFPGKYWNL